MRSHALQLGNGPCWALQLGRGLHNNKDPAQPNINKIKLGKGIWTAALGELCGLTTLCVLRALMLKGLCNPEDTEALCLKPSQFHILPSVSLLLSGSVLYPFTIIRLCCYI